MSTETDSKISMILLTQSAIIHALIELLSRTERRKPVELIQLLTSISQTAHESAVDKSS